MKKIMDLNIPVGAIKNLSEVFEEERAKDLILKEEIDGINTLRVKTAIFKIS